MLVHGDSGSANGCVIFDLLLDLFGCHSVWHDDAACPAMFEDVGLFGFTHVDQTSGRRALRAVALAC